jgi:hypothetical protein
MNNIRIKSTRFIGMVSGLKTVDYSVIGQDGGQSISLGDRVLFVFSDTLIDPRSHLHPGHAANVPFQMPHGIGKGGIFLANCAGVTGNKDLYSGLSGLEYYKGKDGFPREIVEPTDTEQNRKIRFWPEHGIFIDGKVYLYYLGIQTIDPGSIWGFRNLGTGLAVLDPKTGECERITPGGEWCIWKIWGDDFHFGVQVIREGDELFVFASVREWLFSSVRLARVHVSSITDPRAYEYLGTPDPTWTGDAGKAFDLGRCSPEFSVSYNPFIKKYMMTFIDEYDKKLTLRTADQIWGPFSPPVKIAAVPLKESNRWVYLGFEHPEFRKNDGQTVYISYCQPYFSPNSIISVSFY